MNFDRIRQATAAGEADKIVRATETFRIFLAGPYIKIGEPLTQADNNKSLASRLRYHLHEQLSAKGFNIYLGEDVELRNIGEKHYGSHNNAVIFERHYIVNHVDAVIALPSSPGSFCEIGDWVSDKNICEDMLIVVDKIYENHTNYINDGVIKFAKKNHATAEYISYSDLADVLASCEKFLTEVAERKRIDKLYGRG